MSASEKKAKGEAVHGGCEEGCVRGEAEYEGSHVRGDLRKMYVRMACIRGCI